MQRYDGLLVHWTQDDLGPIEVVEDALHRALHFGTEPKQSSMLLSDPLALVLSYTREISHAVARAVDMDSALVEIITIARPVFIFDNMVLYIQREGDSLEPSYARAIGRGRSNECATHLG